MPAIELTWKPWALLGLAAAALAFAAAALVFWAGPDRRLNRAAALVLFVDGVHILTSGLVAWIVLADIQAAYAAVLLHFLLDGVEIPLYLWFVGRALDTPLSRPFRRRAVLALVSAPVAFFALVALVRPASIVPGVVLVDHWYWTVGASVGWPVTAVLFALGLTFFYTLAAAVHAWRRAKTPLARRQGLAYVLAFGLRDLGWGTALFLAFAWLGGFLGDNVLDILGGGFVFFGAAVLLYSPLLVYGILRFQLLGIDLKVKIAIERSTLVAIFAGFVFVAGEAAEQLLGVDRLVPAVLAAAVIALALRPLLRFGERVAGRLMPGVEDTPEYREARGRELYRAALESAAMDGIVTARERAILETLRERLGFTADEAERMERDVAAAGPP